MAVSWLNALENLQGQFSGYPEVEKLFEKDFQWVNEILDEATTLFKKDTTQDVSETTNENDDPNTLGVEAPVLLPQTPGVKKDRAERLGNSRQDASRRSSIRGVSRLSRRSGVLTGALAGKRTSRQASKAAGQKISKTVAAMANLGKKMRRPTMQGANNTTSFAASNGSNDDISQDSLDDGEETEEPLEVEETKDEEMITEEQNPMEIENNDETEEEEIVESQDPESPPKKAKLDLGENTETETDSAIDTEEDSEAQMDEVMTPVVEKPTEAPRSQNRRLTRTKAKVEEVKSPVTEDKSEEAEQPEVKTPVVEKPTEVPSQNRRLTRTKAKK